MPGVKGSNELSGKWIFKMKDIGGLSGSVETPETRLAARGFPQILGLNYCETYAPLANLPSIRLVLAIWGPLNLELHECM